MDLVGILAVLASSLNVTPQLWKSYRTKRTNDISFGMLGVIIAGNLLWIVHGIRRSDPALVFANGVLLVTTVALGVLKLHYDRDGH